MFKKRGQATIEYAVIFIIVLGAFVATSHYIKRGIQGRWKQSVDSFGDQYDPTWMTTYLVYTQSANTTSILKTHPTSGGFWTEKLDTSNSILEVDGAMRVDGY